MTVYVDALVKVEAMEREAHRVGAKHGHEWCHLLADTPEELREIAADLGLWPEWLQAAGTPREHYDLTPPRREKAVRLGAVEIDRRTVVDVIRRKRTAITARAA